jgi:hypothetical protein
MIYNVEQIIAEMKRLGYAVFERDDKEFNLNLVGVRSKENKTDKFNDSMYVFYRFNGAWQLWQYQITTDPGLYWLLNPMNVNGTAILKPGQYRGLWKIGLHLGLYEALVQAAPCTVIRDYDRDANLDYDSGREDTGIFGINCHHAHASGVSYEVGKWSAGCQVFAGIDDWYLFMQRCRYAMASFGNSFTYTLLAEKEMVV